MKVAVTLVAKPGSKAMLIDLAAKLQHELGRDYKVDWLSDGEAVDLILSACEDDLRLPHDDECASFHGQGHDEVDLGQLKKAAAAIVADFPVDFCLQWAVGRRKRLLIADMDSTVIGQECLDELAELKGIKPEIAAITERAMRGEMPFEAALFERIRLLKGLSRRDMQTILKERIKLNPGARTLVQTMKAHGAYTVLVSGGFTFFTEAVAVWTGFDEHRANVFLWDGEVLAGVAEPILGREAKLKALKEATARRGLSASETIAVGDGANDLAMLKAAGLGVAYYAKPVVAAEAGAKISNTDLTALLYFQGFRRSEFQDSSAAQL